METSDSAPFTVEDTLEEGALHFVLTAYSEGCAYPCGCDVEEEFGNHYSGKYSDEHEEVALTRSCGNVYKSAEGFHSSQSEADQGYANDDVGNGLCAATFMVGPQPVDYILYRIFCLIDSHLFNYELYFVLSGKGTNHPLNLSPLTLSSSVGSPHHFAAEGGEETLSFSGYDLDRVRSFSYVKDDFLFVAVAASVNGN